MSIKPIYTEEIIAGKKKYEYRKVKPKDDNIEKIIIYETSPIMKVVAEVQVLDIIYGTKEDVWDITKNFSGISKEFYDEYFKNNVNSVAYKLGEVRVYKMPKELKEFGIKYAPQSFIYLK